MTGYMQIKTPVIGIPNWWWKKKLTQFLHDNNKNVIVQNDVIVENKDLCYECSRHLSLLKTFDDDSKEYEITEYFQYQIFRGKKKKGVFKKIEAFKILYDDFLKNKKFDSNPIITDDGCRLDGSHRLAILQHVGLDFVEVSLAKYEWLFNINESKQIRKQVEKYRQEKYNL